MYPHLVPVKPAVLENEQNSIAHLVAPSISNMLLGSDVSSINASYAASNSIIALLSIAKSTHYATSMENIKEGLDRLEKLLAD